MAKLSRSTLIVSQYSAATLITPIDLRYGPAKDAARHRADDDQDSENDRFCVGEGEAYNVPVEVAEIRYAESGYRDAAIPPLPWKRRARRSCSTR
jgi:hypothetical protein